MFIFTSLGAGAGAASVYSLVFTTIMSENQETEDDQTLDVQASRPTCNNPSAFINSRDPDTNSPCAPKADNHTAAYYAKTQDPSGRMAGKPGDPSDLHGRGGYFIAVHVGAGYHAPQNSRAYRRVMRRACWAAAEILSQVWFFFPPLFLIKVFSPHTAFSLLVSDEEEEKETFSLFRKFVTCKNLAKLLLFSWR